MSLDDHKILGVRRNVFFLGLVSFFNDFSAEMVYSVMPAFLTSVLGAPPIFLGFMEGFVDAVASFFKIFSGWLSDKMGRRKIFAVLGYSLSTATRSLLVLAGSLTQVFALRIVDRFGKGLRDSPRDALLSESVEAAELGRSFGFSRAMDRAGAIFGPLGALALLPLLAGDYRRLFFVAFLLGFLAVLTFLFVREVRTKEEIAPLQPVPFSLSLFSLKSFSREFKLFLLAIFIFGLGVMPEALMLLKSQDVGLSLAAMPLMYLVYTVSFTAFAIPFGRVSDKIGEKRVIVGGFLAAILSYIVLAQFNSWLTVAIGFIFFGLYSAMTDGVERALVSKLVESAKLAQGLGFMQAATGFSALLGGLIGGGIWTLVGAPAAFTYGVVMMFIGLVVFVRLNGLHRKSY